MGEECERPALTGAEAHEAAAEAQFLAELRAGKTEAGRRFVQEYYPGIYRHLLYLTGQRESAEDLTQETFFQAWRHLERFEGRAPLRHWLHRIAHREFLRALRSRRAQISLEEAGDLPAADAEGWMDAVELRELVRKLPLEQREAVVLHYLEGYSCAEIARIVGAPEGTVKYRLSEARGHMQRQLGEGDLAYLNEQPLPMRQWAWLPLDQIHALEARMAMAGIQGTSAHPSSTSAAGRRTGGPGSRAIGRTDAGADDERQVSLEEPMERREFLRRTAVGAAGLMLPAEEVVDGRLVQKVSLGLKGMALSDVCAHLKAETGVSVVAGNSVADEKVTLFCQKLPLREVMRQLSRPFGYAWVRSGSPGAYRYELVQDLRSQLLEEELRNRDRNEALLALERDLQRYRPYLGLTPDEALAQSKGATGPRKALLETLAEPGWAAIQLYFRLSTQELAAMRAGQQVTYSGAPRPGERPLPPEIGRGILQAFRDRRLAPQDGRYNYTPDATVPGAVAPAALPDASGRVDLRILQPEIGRFALHATVTFFTLVHGSPDYNGWTHCTCGSGMSETTVEPRNSQRNAALASDPAMRRLITIAPAAPSDGSQPAASVTASANGSASPGPVAEATGRKVATADVLEAIHRATGLPVIGESYTRLYEPSKLSVQNMPLFEALNQLADATRFRWRREDAWLQFRTTNYYDERVKEVPNRLLSRWAEARRRQGMLTIEEVVEIAQLSDAQLDATSMAEGAREQWGLVEWDRTRDSLLRPHLRFLAGFTPDQRQEAMRATGLLFSKMSLAQQQRYLALCLTGDPLESLNELAGASLRVDYTQPGWFQWGACGWSGRYTRWVVPLEFTPQGRRVPRPPIRERTREATLQAVRLVDPELRQALLAATCRADPRLPLEAHVVEEDQIVPTTLDLAFIYIPGSTNIRPVYEEHGYDCGWIPL
jgi:RNA polymerase sigma-70 factor, ECF subfamily